MIIQIERQDFDPEATAPTPVATPQEMTENLDLMSQCIQFFQVFQEMVTTRKTTLECCNLSINLSELEQQLLLKVEFVGKAHLDRLKQHQCKFHQFLKEKRLQDAQYQLDQIKSLVAELNKEHYRRSTLHHDVDLYRLEALLDRYQKGTQLVHKIRELTSLFQNELRHNNWSVAKTNLTKLQTKMGRFSQLRLGDLGFELDLNRDQLEDALRTAQIEELQRLHKIFTGHINKQSLAKAEETLRLFGTKREQIHPGVSGSKKIPRSLDPISLAQQLTAAKEEVNALAMIEANRSTFQQALRESQMVQAESTYYMTMATLRSLKGAATQALACKLETDWKKQLEECRTRLGAQEQDRALRLQQIFDHQLKAGHVEAARMSLMDLRRIGEQLDLAAFEKPIHIHVLEQKLEKFNLAMRNKIAIDTLVDHYREQCVAGEWGGLDSSFAQIQKNMDLFGPNFTDTGVIVPHAPVELQGFRMMMMDTHKERSVIEKSIEEFKSSCKSLDLISADLWLADLKDTISEYSNRGYKALDPSETIDSLTQDFEIAEVKVTISKFKVQLSRGYIRNAGDLLTEIKTALDNFDQKWTPVTHPINYEKHFDRLEEARAKQSFFSKLFGY